MKEKEEYALYYQAYAQAVYKQAKGSLRLEGRSETVGKGKWRFKGVTDRKKLGVGRSTEGKALRYEYTAQEQGTGREVVYGLT